MCPEPVYLPRARRPRMGGFALPMAIFLLVVMAGLAAYMVRVFTLMRGSFDMSIQGVNAYQAALAGLEWGQYQVQDPSFTWTSGALPACPATTTLSGLAGGLSGFSIQVSCASNSYNEGNHLVSVYRFTSIATQGTSGTLNYVERRAQSLVTLCKDPTASTWRYRCS